MKRYFVVLMALMAVLLVSSCAKNEGKCTCGRGEKGSDTVMVLSPKRLDVKSKDDVSLRVVDADYCLHFTKKLLNYIVMDVKFKCKGNDDVSSSALTDFVNGPLYLYFCNQYGKILTDVVPLASSYKDDAKLKEALKKGGEVCISFVGMIPSNLAKNIDGFTIGYGVTYANQDLRDKFRLNCNTSSMEQVEKWDKLIDELETTYLKELAMNKQTDELNPTQLDSERSKLNGKKERMWAQIDSAVKAHALAPMQMVRLGGIHMKAKSIEEGGFH